MSILQAISRLFGASEKQSEKKSEKKPAPAKTVEPPAPPTFSLEESGAESGRDDANGHAYVDLALTSGTLWATCDIGSAAPDVPGDYFAWGETTPKDFYREDNYKWNKVGETFEYLKYCVDKYDAYQERPDGKTVLEPADDAAHANWGGAWRMPTREEVEELIRSCKWERMSVNGHVGFKVTGWNKHSIFLPVAGMMQENQQVRKEEIAMNWSASLDESVACNATSLFAWTKVSTYGGFRHYGHTVRPVLSAKK